MVSSIDDQNMPAVNTVLTLLLVFYTSNTTVRCLLSINGTRLLGKDTDQAAPFNFLLNIIVKDGPSKFRIILRHGISEVMSFSCDTADFTQGIWNLQSIKAVKKEDGRIHITAKLIPKEGRYAFAAEIFNPNWLYQKVCEEMIISEDRNEIMALTIVVDDENDDDDDKEISQILTQSVSHISDELVDRLPPIPTYLLRRAEDKYATSVGSQLSSTADEEQMLRLARKFSKSLQTRSFDKIANE